MTYTTALELDQQQRSVQSAIAEDLFTSGESDGFDGVYPQCRDFDYLVGYAQGAWRFSSHLQQQALLLQQERQTVEALIAEF